MRIDVNLGAELRDEQGQRQPPADVCHALARHLQHHDAQKPITKASIARFIAGPDFEPQDSAALPL